MFAAFSQWKVEERLKSAVMLAPVVYLSHMPFGVTYVYCHAYIGEVHNISSMSSVLKLAMVFYLQEQTYIDKISSDPGDIYSL